MFYVLQNVCSFYHAPEYFLLKQAAIRWITIWLLSLINIDRSSHPVVLLRKGVLKICSKITLRYGCSPVNLLHILRTPFLKNTSEWLLLKVNMKVRLVTKLTETRCPYTKYNSTCVTLFTSYAPASEWCEKE